MIRIGFWFDYGLQYAGGLNYFRNLLFAVRQVQPEDVETMLFIGHDISAALEEELGRFTRIVKLDILTKGTWRWFVHRLLYRGFRNQFMVERELRRHRIDVLSHPSMVQRIHRRFRLISWIPDFQYLHLPALSPHIDPLKRAKVVADLHRHSDALVLSSQDAHKDFCTVTGQVAPERTHVIPFVSQLHLSEDPSPERAAALRAKYKLPERYIFLPNQFWVHKNHRRAFEALALLKREGLELNVVCTGWMRDPNHTVTASTSAALDVIEREGLHQQVRLLGSIEYADVLRLMRESVAVLNPSLFEGWSSSVEESKSMGKPLIASDIPVHREQAHPDALYFEPNDAAALADCLKKLWLERPAGASEAQELVARIALRKRTMEFGQRYLKVLREVVAR